jgi:Spy/CpxP family protein refolding chaperone
VNIPQAARGFAVLAITFAAGVIAGVGYSRHSPAQHTPNVGSPAMLHAHLREMLSLTDAQDSTVRAILARHQSTVDSSWGALQPRVRSTLDSTLREISSVLTPEQVARFRQLVATMHPVVHR